MLPGLGASIKFLWDPADGAATYLLVASTNGGSWSITTTNTTHTLTDLVPGVEHTFQVFGVNDFGIGPGSDTLVLVPSDPIVITPTLDPPTSIEFAGLLLGVNSQWALQLKWKAVTNAVRYQVEVRDLVGAALFTTETVTPNVQVQKLRFNETNTVHVFSIDNSSIKSSDSAKIPVYIRRDIATNMLNFTGTIGVK